MPSSILWSRWNCSSSSSSRSAWPRRRRDFSRKGSVNHQCSSRMPLGLGELDDVGDGGRQQLPARRLGLELPPAQAGERIELRTPVVLRLLPLGLDPAFLLQLVECGVEGAFAHLQYISREGSQATTDGPPVQRLQGEDLQEQKVEGALDEVGGFAHIGLR